MSNLASRPQPPATHSDSDSDESDRGRVVEAYIAEFNRGDIVYIRTPREGPYKIENVLRKSRTFTLCNVDTSTTAKDGREFSAEELEK